MSEEKPPEAPSAPLRPYWKDSGSKGCVIAYLGFIIAGLIFIGVSGGWEVWKELAPYLFYVAVIVIYPLWPIWLIMGIVAVGVSLGRMKRREIGDKSSTALQPLPQTLPQTLPRTQSEESSNQEEEKIQPGKES